jgi:hypothetical protein
MDNLRGINTQVETGNAGKIIGALVVALAIGAVGAYTYETGMWKSSPRQIVPNRDLPSPGLPSAVPTLVPPAAPLTH